MARKKKLREKGKLKFSRAFQELKEGDKVSIVRELAMHPKFPKRIQGRTGVVEKKRGKAFIIGMKDINKNKKFIIDPIHLKKVK